MPTPGLISRKKQGFKDICIPMFTAALFTIDKTKKQLKCHNRRMDKEDLVHIHTHTHTHTPTYICIYNGILAIKKNEIMPFAAA